MKIKQEYPATHSMSTAWYIVDEEGNVGIIDYNDNGPVPWQLEETCVENLVYGHAEESIPIALTEEQIDDLMESPHSPEEEELWFDCIVQIDLNKKSEFLELAKNPDIDCDHCISKARGLYELDAYGCIDNNTNQITESSTLKKMLDNKMIKAVFRMKNFWMDDEWENNKIVHSKSFTNAPYYIFHQPYWNQELPKCMNIPKHPVKLKQFPLELRDRVSRVPLKFSETKSFQIAEWYPCSMTSNDPVIVDGYEYDLLPLTNGSFAYVNTDMALTTEFFKFCSEKEKYHCKECGWKCYTCHSHCFTGQPTVLFIRNPLQKWNYELQFKSDVIVWHSVWIPLLPLIPYKIPNKSYSDGYESCPSEAKISKYVSQTQMVEYFKKNRQWFEDIVKRVNPRVVILCDEAKGLIETVYSFNQDHIEIGNKTYPLFLFSALEANRKEIERLALLSYQGKIIPHIITTEEMDKIKSNNDRTIIN